MTVGLQKMKKRNPKNSDYLCKSQMIELMCRKLDIDVEKERRGGYNGRPKGGLVPMGSFWYRTEIVRAVFKEIISGKRR